MDHMINDQQFGSKVLKLQACRSDACKNLCAEKDHTNESAMHKIITLAHMAVVRVISIIFQKLKL